MCVCNDSRRYQTVKIVNVEGKTHHYVGTSRDCLEPSLLHMRIGLPLARASTPNRKWHGCGYIVTIIMSGYASGGLCDYQVDSIDALKRSASQRVFDSSK